MGLLIAVGHRLHKLDASLQRPAANEPGHPDACTRVIDAARVVPTLCSLFNDRSCIPTINFRHLGSSRGRLVNTHQRLVQSYLHLPESRQLTAGETKLVVYACLEARAPFGPSRCLQNSVRQLLHVSRLIVQPLYNHTTNIDRPVDTLLLLARSMLIWCSGTGARSRLFHKQSGVHFRLLFAWQG